MSKFKLEHEFGKPFARAAAMFAAIEAARQLLAHTPLQFRAALHELGEYTSRGKGGRRSKPGINYRTRVGAPTNTPHYGKKQKARDEARAFKAAP